MEVAQGIHRIEVPFGERVIFLYLLVGSDRTLLVDTGIDSSPREYVVPYLSALGMRPEQIDYVVISHSDLDHQGGNVSMRELAPDAHFMCHVLDRRLIESIDLLIARRYGEFAADHGIDESDESKAWMRANNRSETPIDIALTGGETIRLGPDWAIEVLHTPGHSHGHLTIYDPRSRAAIIADTTLWNCVPARTGEAAFPPTYRYVDTYLASMHRLQGMEISQLLTSHYVRDLTGSAVAEFLGESRAFVERVEAALRTELARTGRDVACNVCTTRELVETLSPRLGTWPKEAGIALVFPLMGHLERLEQHGMIARGRREGLVIWRWNA